MQANGAVVGLIDVPQEHTQDYNVWYDFDHLPEFVALDDMLLGRRYVADTECKAARPNPSKLPELAGGKGSYCSTYFMRTDDIGAVMGYWNEAGVRLRKEKRIFRHGKIADVTFYKLIQAHARPGIPVVEAAIPYLGHQGIYVVMAEVADPAMRPAVNEWFAEAHAKDLLAVPGVVAAMRLEAHAEFGTGAAKAGRYMNLYLLDEDPVQTVAEIQNAREGWVARGTSPAPGGASNVLFQSPYRCVTPTRYDFRVE